MLERRKELTFRFWSFPLLKVSGVTRCVPTHWVKERRYTLVVTLSLLSNGHYHHDDGDDVALLVRLASKRFEKCAFNKMYVCVVEYYGQVRSCRELAFVQCVLEYFLEKVIIITHPVKHVSCGFWWLYYWKAISWMIGVKRGREMFFKSVEAGAYLGKKPVKGIVGHELKSYKSWSCPDTSWLTLDSVCNSLLCFLSRSPIHLKKASFQSSFFLHSLLDCDVCNLKIQELESVSNASLWFWR